MARIKLEMPEEFGFATELPISIGDINYGGHVGNERFLALAHEARIRFLADRGYTELDIEGLGLIITDAALVYKSQVFHGQSLSGEVAAADFNKYGCDFYYRMSNLASGQVAALVKTGMVLMDYDAGRPALLPEKFRAALGG